MYKVILKSTKVRKKKINTEEVIIKQKAQQELLWLRPI